VDQHSVIRTAADAAELLAPLFEGEAEESIAVLHLDSAGRVLGTGRFRGEPDEAELPLRAIIAEALGLGAEAMVVAHNHPSGDPSPSALDCEATSALAETARRVGIRLLDHLVFAGGEMRSFRELGLL
jgi:DNA repair protein RadC